MPLPPPKASTEGPRDREVGREVDQLVRALRADGPLTPERLAELVGAAYWEPQRFDRALALALADGRCYRTDEGFLATS